MGLVEKIQLAERSDVQGHAFEATSRNGWRPLVVAPEESLRARRKPRWIFSEDHFLVVRRRSAHGLARVMNQEIEARFPVEHLRAEGFQRWCITQVQRMYLQTPLPFSEIGFPLESRRGIASETRRRDDARARPKQHQRNFEADLHARARNQRDAFRKVGALVSFQPIERCAFGTHRIVVMMELGETPLADIA